MVTTIHLSTFTPNSSDGSLRCFGDQPEAVTANPPPVWAGGGQDDAGVAHHHRRSCLAGRRTWGCPAAGEVQLNWNNGVRQAHRWLGVIFTVTVIVSMVAAGQEDPAVWVFYLPLPPLVLQLVTGLYLFVLPYVATWRGARRATSQT